MAVNRYKRCIKWRVVGVSLVIGLCMAGQAHADCITDAAQRYHVNPDVLRAIAYYESHLNPDALNHDANGTVDVGIMQINSIHFPTLRREGIDLKQLQDPAVNADVGAALLRDAVNQYGPTWRAVGAYHSRTPSLGSEYAHAVHQIYLARPWLKPCRQDPESRLAANGVQVTPLKVD